MSALYRGAFIKVWHWFDNLLVGMGAEDHSMRAVTEYRNRAQECRKLATMVHKLEDIHACLTRLGIGSVSYQSCMPSVTPPRFCIERVRI